MRRRTGSRSCKERLGPERVKEAAERRPADRRKLHRGGGGGDRPGKQRCRHNRRQQGLLGRGLERARDPEDEDGREDEFFGDPSGDRREHERGRDRRLDDLANLQHAAPVVPVGDLAGHQHEHRHWQELHKADETEVEGAAGQLIHLPGDGDAHHHEAERRAGARAPIEHERTMAQDGVRHGVVAAHRGWEAFVGVNGEV